MRHLQWRVRLSRALLAGATLRARDTAAGQAFLFLNRYIDISEAMDDGRRSSDALDGSAFAATDVPARFPLPAEHYVRETTREEVRDWVLELSMDRNLKQELAQRPCGTCGKETYAAGLRCGGCRAVSEMCVVTGYPVGSGAGERVVCNGHPARRAEWNMYVGTCGACPWCAAPAQPKL